MQEHFEQKSFVIFIILDISQHILVNLLRPDGNQEEIGSLVEDKCQVYFEHLPISHCICHPSLLNEGNENEIWLLAKGTWLTLKFTGNQNAAPVLFC